MTAAEWDTSTNPEDMLTMLSGEINTARLPVVLAGFADRGRLPRLLRTELRQQFLSYARWVFGLGVRPLPIELSVFDPSADHGPDVWDAEEGVRFAMSGDVDWSDLLGILYAERCGSRWVISSGRPNDPNDPEGQRQADALRDALGKPFAPVTWEAGWRSETVTALAKCIHFDNAFDRLPILADALEEAGCDHADVLDHCRGPGPHARGCWVVDAARGK